MDQEKQDNNRNHMVITKRAISQRVLVVSTVVSLLLISGALYLQLRQKHHLGRINISDRRANKPAETVVNDDNRVETLEANQPTNKINTNTNRKSKSSSNDYEDEYYVDYVSQDGDDYPNDATTITNSQNDKRKDPKATHKSTKTTVKVENGYGADYNNEEYIDSISARTRTQDSDSNATVTFELSQQCLHCLCTAVNGCEPIKCDRIDPCGIYGISKYYWLDGGALKAIEEKDYDYGEENKIHIDYLRCVNDEKCAQETVRKYMKRYQRDCNNDGVIDCQDFIALHILGPSGCTTKQLSPIHKNRIKTC